MPETNELPILVCLPYAGAGPSVFNGWRPLLQDAFEMVQPSFAGKEKRFAQPPQVDMGAQVADIAMQLREPLERRPAAPVVVFGHSLGAILAYELGRMIERRSPTRPLHLVASGSASPLLRRRGKASGLSDDEFVREVESLAGYTHPALADPDMRGLLLPALRADVEMHESYRHAWKAPSAIAITCLHGRQDQVVNVEEARKWHDVTRGQFELQDAEGGHMVWVENPQMLGEVLKAIGRRFDDLKA